MGLWGRVIFAGVGLFLELRGFVQEAPEQQTQDVVGEVTLSQSAAGTDP